MRRSSFVAEEKSHDLIKLMDPGPDSSLEYFSTIGAMARDFNVSLRALRFYEDRGLLHPKRRGSTRLYSTADRRHLEMILRGKQLGFTLTEIHDIIRSHKDSAKIDDLESTLQPDQIIAQINHLERQREEINEAINALRDAHQKLNRGADFDGAQG